MACNENPRLALQRTARVAGLLYLLVIVFGLFAE